MPHIISSLSTGLILAALSVTHWVVIAVLILVLFGGKKLPELARGMARGLRIFKEELHSVKKEIGSGDDILGDQRPDSTAKPTQTDAKDEPDQPKVG